VLVHLKPGLQVETDYIAAIECDDATLTVTVTLSNGKAYALEPLEGQKASETAMQMGQWINQRRANPNLWVAPPPEMQGEEEGSRIVMPPAGLVVPN